MSVVGITSRISKAAMIVAFAAGVTVVAASPASSGPAPVSPKEYTAPVTDQQFDVPDGVCRIDVVAWGARGGDGRNQDGAQGGTATTTIAVEDTDTLFITVGSRGNDNSDNNTGGAASAHGGGGSGGDSTGGQAGGGGGGASVVKQNATQVVVAGGGGGGSGASADVTTGGGGGGQVADDGTRTGGSAGAGKGGDQNSGGAAGDSDATAGSLGQGGNGAGNSAASGGGGGGGGGGYYGGGGGGSVGFSEGAGGGGGSGFTPDGFGMTTGDAPTTNSGNGKVVLKWEVGGCDEPRPPLVSPLTLDPGTYDFVVPVGVCSVVINASGATGGDGKNGTGGEGGTATRTISVTPHETLQINVGSEGEEWTEGTGGGPSSVGGGGAGGGSTASSPQPAGGGGGASDVRQGGTALANRVLVAGGGGGGGGASASSVIGGDGGGENAGAGVGVRPGGGGTQSGGGAAGSEGSNASGATAGVLGDGGQGSSITSGEGGGGGGGGGGYFGGGGAGAAGFTSGSGGGGGSGYAPDGTTTTGGNDSGDGQVTLTYRQDCPTANLTLQKDCLGTMSGEPFAIEVRDSTNALADEPAELNCDQSLAEPYEIFVGEEYTVLETEVPPEADDVRYRGACDGDGTLTATSPGQNLTCVVTNVNLVDLIVQKNCSHPLLIHDTFEIKVYRESVSANNLEATLNLGCGENNSADPLRIDDTVQYIVQETDPGHLITVDYRHCDGDGVFTVAGSEVRCQIANNLPRYTALTPPETEPGTGVTPEAPPGTTPRPPASSQPVTSKPKPHPGKVSFSG